MHRCPASGVFQTPAPEDRADGVLESNRMGRMPLHLHRFKQLRQPFRHRLCGRAALAFQRVWAATESKVICVPSDSITVAEIALLTTEHATPPATRSKPPVRRSSRCVDKCPKFTDGSTIPAPIVSEPADSIRRSRFSERMLGFSATDDGPSVSDIGGAAKKMPRPVFFWLPRSMRPVSYGSYAGGRIHGTRRYRIIGGRLAANR